MLNYLIGSLLALVLVLNTSFTLVANCAEQGNTDASSNGSPWSMSLRGSYVYQFDADLDQGRGFNTSRLFIEGGPVYSPDHRRSVSLSVGYGFDGYDFSGNRQAPWQDVHSLSLGVPVRWGFGRAWTFIGVPTIRFAAENSSDWDNGVTGGGFAGFSYRFSDRLTIGPGIGMLSQLEDDASVFPILIINWKFTDRLSLETGRGMAATQGPGLTLNWNLNDRWDFFMGGRYEQQRFRLARENPVPGGIGEKSSFPLMAGANYSFSKKIKASLAGGMDFGGELRQEDRDGNLVAKEDYDPALFLGVTFSGQF
ncbi:MAG: hypothetical protein ACYDBT_02850 [Desulfobulbaceae bacterium]